VPRRPSPAAAVRRPRLPPGERRALIEDAAARLFAERGYAGTTLDDIAAAANVTKPMIYRHFESKKALHLALLAKHRNQLAARALAHYTTEAPLESRLPAMLEAWFSYVEEHPYAWRMLFRDTTGDPDVQAFHREIQAWQRTNDMRIITEHLPSLPDAEVEPLAEVMRSSLTGLALWWLEHPNVPRSVLVDAMLRVLRGFLAAERLRPQSLLRD
jgi:AcrR family transcriptional regulator